MRSTIRRLAVITVLLVAVSASAARDRLMLPAGTDVTLAFDQNLSSRSAHVGDLVRFRVVNDVMMGNSMILGKGTPVTGTISRVDKRKAYGVNAKIRIALSPVRSTFGQMIPLEPRSRGKYVRGEKSEKAGAATAGGAIIAGPVGLIGGLFIHGKPVKVHKGDILPTEVSNDTWLRR